MWRDVCGAINTLYGAGASSRAAVGCFACFAVAGWRRSFSPPQYAGPPSLLVGRLPLDSRLALTIGAKLNDGGCGLRNIKIETVVESQLISRVRGGVQGSHSRTAHGKRGQSQAIGRSKHLAPD